MAGIPVEIAHFGGLYPSASPEMLTMDLSPDCLNVQFTEFGVQSRWGLSQAIALASRARVNGIVGLNLLASAQQIPLLFSADGKLWRETPVGSGGVAPITSAQVPLVASAYMNGAVAYGRAYLAFGDGKVGLGVPASFDGTNLDPITIVDPLAGKLPPPNNPALAFDTSNGTVPNGTYYGVMVGVDQAGSLTGASAEVSVTVVQVGGKAEITATATAINGAASYRLYLGTAPGAENQYFTSSSPSFTITALGGTAGAPPALGLQAIDSGVGNICSGVRYGIVLYRMRSGSYSPASLPFSWNAAGAKGVAISGLPIGPANVTGRVLAFAVAGGSSAGPFLMIGENTYVNGVLESATLIPDNVTTTVTLSFDDTFLASSTDLTATQAYIQLPDQVGVIFSRATRRMIWWGESSSVLRISGVDDAGTYAGDTGFAQIAENDGQRIAACFELDDQIYVLKERGLYLLEPNTGEPATWEVRSMSDKVGCPGPRAVDVGPGFAIWVDRGGVWQFTGGAPTWLSEELTRPDRDRPSIWERINWSYEHLIWVHIDTLTQEVRIGIPLDGATVPSHILKMNYRNGFEPSFHMTLMGKMHWRPGRAWSLDTIAALQAVRVERALAVPGLPPDRRQQVSQVLVASANADGIVAAIDPAADTDNTQPFTSYYQTGTVAENEIIAQQFPGRVLSVNPVICNVRGKGRAYISAVLSDGSEQTIGKLDLLDSPIGFKRLPCMVIDERPMFKISSRGEGGTWALKSLVAGTKPIWRARP